MIRISSGDGYNDLCNKKLAVKTGEYAGRSQYRVALGQKQRVRAWAKQVRKELRW